MKSADFRLNPVIECATPLLNLALPFNRGNHGKDLDVSYREKIFQGFNEMERLAYNKQIHADTIKDMKYAMAAFVDEAILNSKWVQRSEWMAEPLQLRYFGQHLAGEGFFERLKQLRQGGERNTDILELYYVCLQLGFEGIYRLHGYEQLMALQVDLRSQIETYRGSISPALSPNAKPKSGIIQQVRKEVPFWVIGAVTAAIVISIYVTYSFIIDKVADSTVNTIAKNNTNIVQVLRQR